MAESCWARLLPKFRKMSSVFSVVVSTAFSLLDSVFFLGLNVSHNSFFNTQVHNCNPFALLKIEIFFSKFFSNQCFYFTFSVFYRFGLRKTHTYEMKRTKLKYWRSKYLFT